jgi:hypothetical protein
MEEIREMNGIADDFGSRPNLQRVHDESSSPGPFACMILPDHKEDTTLRDAPKVNSPLHLGVFQGNLETTKRSILVAD